MPPLDRMMKKTVLQASEIVPESCRPAMDREKSWRIHPLQIAGVVIILVVWELAAHYVLAVNPKRASTILPTLESIFLESLPELATFYGIGMGGQYAGAIKDFNRAFLVIGYNSLITIGRLLAGTALGAFLGIGVGLILSMNKNIRALIEPPVLLVRTIPILALIPLFIVWFGGREYGNILFIAFAVFSMLVINTIEAVRNVPPIYGQLASTLGASRWQTFRTVTLPAIIPELGGGLRVVLGLSWAITLAAEYLVVDSGLGRILMLSERFLFMGRMIVVVLLFMIYSVALNGLVLRATRYLTRWMP